jgi:hypothetical protein
MVDPGLLGIEYTIPSYGLPTPAWYAVSVNSLRGMRRDLEFLLRLKPDDRIGYSMYIYHLTREQADLDSAERRHPRLPRSPPIDTGHRQPAPQK